MPSAPDPSSRAFLAGAGTRRRRSVRSPRAGTRMGARRGQARRRCRLSCCRAISTCRPTPSGSPSRSPRARGTRRARPPRSRSPRRGDAAARATRRPCTARACPGTRRLRRRRGPRRAGRVEGARAHRGAAGSRSRSTCRPQPKAPVVGAAAPRAPSPTLDRHARREADLHAASPRCPLHDVSLADVIGTGTPVAAMFATPALCQSQYCGPVLDELLDLRAPYADQG